MTKSVHCMAALGVAVALAACSTQPAATESASAQSMPGAATMGAAAAALSATDRAFVLTALGSNRLEVGAAQMAPKRTNDSDVLALAAAIDRDHTAAMNELETLARKRGMAVPQQLPPDKQSLMDKLGTSQGGDFDEAFVNRLGVDLHRADIATWQRRLPQIADPDLQAWIQRTLPLMQQHLAMAQQVAQKMG